MPRKRTYTDEQFIEAVEKSLSWRQVLQKLNLNATGGNHNRNNTYDKWGVDISGGGGTADSAA